VRTIKIINRPFGQKEEFTDVKTDGIYSYHCVELNVFLIGFLDKLSPTILF
jgi:hypothetical protein